MFSLACIIPVIGDTEGLETTLLSVLERRTDDCEVLVVLNSPYSDPYRLQGEIQFLQAPQGTGLVGCINSALQQRMHKLYIYWRRDMKSITFGPNLLQLILKTLG